MRSVLVLALLGLAACVDDVAVVGDERAAAACASAELVPVPPAGCTTVRVVSSDPYGCAFGPAGMSLAGSWVRVGGTSGAATIEIRQVEASATCAVDAGPRDGGECTTFAYVTSVAGAGCTCDLGGFVYPGLDGAIELPVRRDEAQLLLQPFGATFDVTVCRTAP